MTRIALASASPRRRELLQQIGVAFDVIRAEVPEVLSPGEPPLVYVQRLAVAKAQAGCRLAVCPTLGADTVVVCEGEVLEKPADETDFMAMFRRLSGTTHQVYTAVALAMPGSASDAVPLVHCLTEVTFREVSALEACNYWRTGEPCDKAGGYGIQGYGAIFIERIAGSYSNVVGLPLYETARLLSRHDIPCWNAPVHE